MILQKRIIMRDQIIEVSSRYPAFAQVGTAVETIAPASYPGAAFWLRVYEPLSDWKAPLPNSRMICPWGIAAELDDAGTPPARKQNILEALKCGLKTMRQYELPSSRIMFAEDNTTRSISVWVD